MFFWAGGSTILRNVASSSATLAVAVLVLATSIPCLACYSGLAATPTADMVPAGQYCLEPQFDGTCDGGSVGTRILNTQFGITPRFEAGVDLDLSDDADPRVLGNFKYLAVNGGTRSPAVALGVCNMGSNMRSSPYVVSLHDFGALRGHVGLMRIEGNNRWFIGADRSLTDRLMLMADYTSGDENCSSVGFNYQFNERFGILGGVLFPNTDGEETGFTLHFVFTGSYLS